MFTSKKRTVKPGYAFENTAILQWFDNLMGCSEAALHLFVEQIPPTDSWHQFDKDRCNFHPLMPAITLLSLLERYLVTSGVGNCHAAWRHQKTTETTRRGIPRSWGLKMDNRCRRVPSGGLTLIVGTQKWGFSCK
jgi:hypothetical protein